MRLLEKSQNLLLDQLAIISKRPIKIKTLGSFTEHKLIELGFSISQKDPDLILVNIDYFLKSSVKDLINELRLIAHSGMLFFCLDGLSIIEAEPSHKPRLDELNKLTRELEKAGCYNILVEFNDSFINDPELSKYLEIADLNKAYIGLNVLSCFCKCSKLIEKEIVC